MDYKQHKALIASANSLGLKSASEFAQFLKRIGIVA